MSTYSDLKILYLTNCFFSSCFFILKSPSARLNLCLYRKNIIKIIYSWVFPDAESIEKFVYLPLNVKPNSKVTF